MHTFFILSLYDLVLEKIFVPDDAKKRVPWSSLPGTAGLFFLATASRQIGFFSRTNRHKKTIDSCLWLVVWWDTAPDLFSPVLFVQVLLYVQWPATAATTGVYLVPFRGRYGRRHASTGSCKGTSSVEIS